MRLLADLLLALLVELADGEVRDQEPEERAEQRLPEAPERERARRCLRWGHGARC